MCLLCGSNKWQKVVRKYEDEYGDYEIRLCTGCQQTYKVVVRHTELAKRSWPGHTGP